MPRDPLRVVLVLLLSAVCLLATGVQAQGFVPEAYRPRNESELQQFMGARRGVVWVMGTLLYPTLERDLLEGIAAKRLEVNIITGRSQVSAFGKLRSAGAKIKVIQNQLSGGFAVVEKYTVARDAKGVLIFDSIESTAVVLEMLKRTWNYAVTP
jgi:hypothetical protein